MKNIAAGNREQGTFEAIARAMARNYQIKVEASGFACDTDGERIRIPFNSEHLKGAAAKVLHGMLDHEVGHVKEERSHKEAGERTPFEILKACRNRKEQLLLNVFEDIRMEIAEAQQHVGVAENLAQANAHSVELFKARHSGAGLERANFWHTLGSAIILKARGLSISWLPKGFEPFVSAVEEEIQASRKIRWARESYALALSVLKKVDELGDALKDEAEKREQEKQEQEKQDQEQDGEGGEAGAEGDEAESDGSEGEKGEGGEAEGEDSGSSSEDEQGEQGEGESKGESKGEEKDSKASKDGGKGEKGDAGEEMSDKQLGDALKQAKKAEGDAEVTDMNEYSKKQIIDDAKRDAVDNARYVPAPEAVKRDFQETPATNMADYNACREKVADQIRGLRGKLLQVIRSRTPSCEVGGERRGKLDTRALATVATGNVNVFKVEIEGEKLDTAVSLLIDMSGSMGDGNDFHDKAHAAKLMTIALAETFEALQVPFEVIGFDTHTTAATYYAGSGYSRCAPMRYHMFKTFAEQYRRVKARLSAITGREDNDDGEAVLFTAKRLMERSESRKILFVLSDGMPASSGASMTVLATHLNEAIEKATKAGIEVIGIGAQTECVQRFYNAERGASNAVINDMSKLATEVYKLMRDRLSKRRAA